MDKRPLAPRPKPFLSFVKPLDTDSPFSNLLSPAARRIARTRAESTVKLITVGNYEGPTREHVLQTVFMGYTVTGPVKPHHLRHFARTINRLAQDGLICHASLVEPSVMTLARNGQLGPGPPILLPERYCLLFYPYTEQNPKQLLEAHGYCFCTEGGLPPAFPEHLYASPLQTDDEPHEPTPPGYWRHHAKAAWGWAWLAAGAIGSGIALATHFAR